MPLTHFLFLRTVRGHPCIASDCVSAHFSNCILMLSLYQYGTQKVECHTEEEIVLPEEYSSSLGYLLSVFHMHSAAYSIGSWIHLLVLLLTLCSPFFLIFTNAVPIIGFLVVNPRHCQLRSLPTIPACGFVYQQLPLIPWHSGLTPFCFVVKSLLVFRCHEILLALIPESTILLISYAMIAGRYMLKTQL